MKTSLLLTTFILLSYGCMSSSTINNSEIEEPSKILICKNSKTEYSNLNEKNCLTQEELEILERRLRKIGYLSREEGREWEVKKNLNY